MRTVQRWHCFESQRTLTSRGSNARNRNLRLEKGPTMMSSTCCLPHCEAEGTIKQSCGHSLCNADGLQLVTISSNGGATLKCPICRNFCRVCPAMLREMLLPVPTHAAALRCGCERPNCKITWAAVHAARRKGCYTCSESPVVLFQLPAERDHPDSEEESEEEIR